MQRTIIKYIQNLKCNLRFPKTMYCFSSVKYHGGWDKTRQSMFATSPGQGGQSGGKVSSSEITYCPNCKLY
jgi:hypothetical protein